MLVAEENFAIRLRNTEDSLTEIHRNIITRLTGSGFGNVAGMEHQVRVNLTLNALHRSLSDVQAKLDSVRDKASDELVEHRVRLRHAEERLTGVEGRVMNVSNERCHSSATTGSKFNPDSVQDSKISTLDSMLTQTSKDFNEMKSHLLR